jgi:hypothetical protein
MKSGLTKICEGKTLPRINGEASVEEAPLEGEALDALWNWRASEVVRTGGGNGEFVKGDFWGEIERRAKLIQQSGEKLETARTRFLKTSPDADALWKAHDLSPDLPPRTKPP